MRCRLQLKSICTGCWAHFFTEWWCLFWAFSMWEVKGFPLWKPAWLIYCSARKWRVITPARPLVCFPAAIPEYEPDISKSSRLSHPPVFFFTPQCQTLMCSHPGNKSHFIYCICGQGSLLTKYMINILGFNIDESSKHLLLLMVTWYPTNWWPLSLYILYWWVLPLEPCYSGWAPLVPWLRLDMKRASLATRQLHLGAN